MATFYPINTPLINYFFYKAPFIVDDYVTTGMTILNGGSSYNVGDIVILNGGVYTSPAVIQVTGIGPLIDLTLSAVTGSSYDPGTGYAVNDIIDLKSVHVSVLTVIPAQVKVLGVNGFGGVTSFELITGGVYSTPNLILLDIFDQLSTTGSGVDFNIESAGYSYSVTGGPIVSFNINNAGLYSTTPTLFTQLGTNGAGIDAQFNDGTFAPNLIPPGPNFPLSGGFLFFYEDENRTVQANTYSDVSDPNNPTVNTDPIQLGAAGECPLFYLDDRFYYIVITDNTGDQSNPVQVIEHYNPSQVSAANITTAFNDNFLVNPQFNYPIVFWETTQKEGEISAPTTRVAFAWDFVQDSVTTTENFVTFENISGQGVEGSPIFQILLNCSTVSSSETLKDFVQVFGTVDFLAESPLTFSAQMINEASQNINVNLLLELNYGPEGSPPQLINLTTFIVTPTRNKYFYSFIMPSITGFTIDDGNYAAIHIRPALGQTCLFGMTNDLLEPGNVALPIFIDEPKSFSKSQIVGDSIDIDGAGLDENYSSYYYENGLIIPYADTGTIVLEPNTTTQLFREKCDGTNRQVNAYSPNKIPYRRLFNVIGNKFGGSGTLIASSTDNIVTVNSSIGAREKSAWTSGTTTFTVTNTVIGLSAGINLISNDDMTVSGSFYNQFAPSQVNPLFDVNVRNVFGPSSPSGLLTYWGTLNNAIDTNNINITTILPGSGVQNATFLMTFNSIISADYKTRSVSSPPYLATSSFIEFATFANNVRQPLGSGSDSVNQLILFSVDGAYDGIPRLDQNPGITFANSYIVPFLTENSILQNIQIFCRTIANPFAWTVTVNVVPTAGQYFLYSDEVTDFYGWFTVNGVGTDPAVPARTGVVIPLFSGYTTAETAQAIALALNTAEFGLPSPAQLPALVTSSLVSWYINL